MLEALVNMKFRPDFSLSTWHSLPPCPNLVSGNLKTLISSFFLALLHISRTFLLSCALAFLSRNTAFPDVVPGYFRQIHEFHYH